jgi:hypothetical protein
LKRVASVALFAICVAAPALAQAQDVKPQVARIVAIEVAPPPVTPSPPTDAQMATMIDHITDMEMRGLSPVPDWGPSAPQWAPMRQRVRDDIQADMPQLLAKATSAVTGQYSDMLNDVAGRVQQADIDKITAYLDTPEGKRYAAFESKLNGLMNQLQQSAPGPHPKASLTPKQIQDYVAIIAESQMVRMMLYVGSHGAETSDPGLAGVIGANAMMQRPDAFEDLDKQYNGDIDGFDAFQKSVAMQRFSAATYSAIQKDVDKSKRPNPSGIVDILAAHRPAWLAYYAELPAKK